MTRSNIYRVEPTKRLGVRFRETKKRVEIKHPALDAGGENMFAKELGISEFVETDLNHYWIAEKKFKTITSLEVIEHLQNPLIYLDCICNSLTDDGVLYLTTPVRWIFRGRHHFHEFRKKDLLSVLHMSGFRNVKIERMRAYDLRHFGIRPIIRKSYDILRGQCYFVTATKRIIDVVEKSR